MAENKATAVFLLDLFFSLGKVDNPESGGPWFEPA